jgi:hypothetical protein
MFKKDINHFYQKSNSTITSYNLTHDLIHFKARLNNGYSRNKCQGGGGGGGVGRHFLFLPTVHKILNDHVLYFFRPIFQKQPPPIKFY